MYIFYRLLFYTFPKSDRAYVYHMSGSASLTLFFFHKKFFFILLTASINHQLGVAILGILLNLVPRFWYKSCNW